VFTICKRHPFWKDNNPLQQIYYTEPFVHRIPINTPENALLGFLTKRKCEEWIAKINHNIPYAKTNIHSNVGSSHVSIHEYNDYNDFGYQSSMSSRNPSFQEDLQIHEFSLNDVKTISDAMRMPLLVVVSDKDTYFELFYYRKPIT
jgi:hypothetical protein